MDEVLSLSSGKALEKGASPDPMVEIEFWNAKCYNLMSLYEQVDLVF